MTNTYDFDKVTTSEKPQIVMGGHTYELRYPTVEELEELQKLETDEQKTDAMFSFITGKTGEEPSFQKAIKKQDVRVLRAFSEMITKEFGVEE